MASIGKMLGVPIAVGALGVTFNLLEGPEAYEQAEVLRGRDTSGLEQIGHMLGDTGHIIHDIVSDPLSDGSYDQVDGLLQLTFAKEIATVAIDLAASAAIWGIVAAAKKRR